MKYKIQNKANPNLFYLFDISKINQFQNLTNCDRKEMFEFCQIEKEKISQEMETLSKSSMTLEQLKNTLIQKIKLASSFQNIQEILEDELNLIGFVSNEKRILYLKMITKEFDDFQNFLMTYLWRVEDKYEGFICYL
jgi:hypothetical protein